MSAPKDNLPKFEDGKSYMLKGSTLNAIMDAIRESRIISIEGAEIERTPQGVRIKVK